MLIMLLLAFRALSVTGLENFRSPFSSSSVLCGAKKKSKMLEKQTRKKREKNKLKRKVVRHCPRCPQQSVPHSVREFVFSIMIYPGVLLTTIALVHSRLSFPMRTKQGIWMILYSLWCGNFDAKLSPCRRCNHLAPTT